MVASQPSRCGDGVSDPGERDTLITFQRGTLVTDDYGSNLEFTSPTLITTAYASVRYGAGDERREAAQNRATQAAIFECDWNPTLAGVTEKDRIFVNETPTEFWNIASKSPLGHREIHFAAVRSA